MKQLDISFFRTYTGCIQLIPGIGVGFRYGDFDLEFTWLAWKLSLSYGEEENEEDLETCDICSATGYDMLTEVTFVTKCSKCLNKR